LPSKLDPEVRTDADLLLQYYMSNHSDDDDEDRSETETVETLNVGEDEDNAILVPLNSTDNLNLSVAVYPGWVPSDENDESDESDDEPFEI
jgi:hypothetical protein